MLITLSANQHYHDHSSDKHRMREEKGKVARNLNQVKCRHKCNHFNSKADKRFIRIPSSIAVRISLKEVLSTESTDFHKFNVHKVHTYGVFVRNTNTVKMIKSPSYVEIH